MCRPWSAARTSTACRAPCTGSSRRPPPPPRRCRAAPGAARLRAGPTERSDMSTVLVVANETLASRSLIERVRARHERGDADFVLVAPMARPSSGFVSYDDVLRDAAQHRVDGTVA